MHSQGDKESGQSEILYPTPISIVVLEVIISQVSVQALNVPYAAVVQQQLLCKGKEVKKKPTQRKSTRVEEAKKERQRKRKK